MTAGGGASRPRAFDRSLGIKRSIQPSGYRARGVRHVRVGVARPTGPSRPTAEGHAKEGGRLSGRGRTKATAVRGYRCRTPVGVLLACP
ncbi:hypothetical protein SLI_5099 [Streptomyces lividans 1326]|uniref:Uncharacterized protein n=1 Tax=Streptomyces lividans 1326 TaxID=1200984 RepID=A0A7U9DXN9_STRLI|nr:hypothetical protein SLI_5099 [Streptomyces lividans 1326]